MAGRRPIIFVVIVAFMVCTVSCIPYRSVMRSHYSESEDTSFKTLKTGERTLGYMHLHRSDTLPTLFFLHGSPSDLHVYDTYYQDSSLSSWANIIAADRPGYGRSEAGKSEVSVRRQAKDMWKILEKEGYPSPLYIIGSSYGGTVAARMAMLKPDKLNGLVLVSASLAPGMETTYDISYLFRYRLFRKLLPSKINVANDEKLAHFESLEEMAREWSEIRAPVILFQGTKDRLIYPENVDFARNQLVNAGYVEYHLLENERHFLQIKYKDLILKRLRKMIERSEPGEDNYSGVVDAEDAESGTE